MVSHALLLLLQPGVAAQPVSRYAFLKPDEQQQRHQQQLCGHFHPRQLAQRPVGARRITTQDAHGSCCSKIRNNFARCGGRRGNSLGTQPTDGFLLSMALINDGTAETSMQAHMLWQPMHNVMPMPIANACGCQGSCTADWGHRSSPCMGLQLAATATAGHTHDSAARHKQHSTSTPGTVWSEVQPPSVF